MSQYIHLKFHNDWFRYSEVVKGDAHRNTDRKMTAKTVGRVVELGPVPRLDHLVF
jgi:hypothetical protein